jgi:hypothetical protein
VPWVSKISPVESARTGENAADVIRVLMRDQDRINIFRSKAKPCQPMRKISRGPNPASTSKRVFPDFDQQGIAAAAAAE